MWIWILGLDLDLFVFLGGLLADPAFPDPFWGKTGKFGRTWGMYRVVRRGMAADYAPVPPKKDETRLPGHNCRGNRNRKFFKDLLEFFFVAGT